MIKDIVEYERKGDKFFFNGKELGDFTDEKVEFRNDSGRRIPYFQGVRMGWGVGYDVWQSFRGYDRKTEPPKKIEILRNSETEEVVENISIFDWVHERVVATSPPYFRLQEYIRFLKGSVQLEDNKHAQVQKKIYLESLRSEFISFGVVACISFMEDLLGSSPVDKRYPKYEELNTYREIRHAVAHYFNRAEDNNYKSRKTLLADFIRKQNKMEVLVPFALDDEGRIIFELEALDECLELVIDYIEWKKT